jgi:hypothetical protein
MRMLITGISTLIAVAGAVSIAEATPQFARRYRVDCSHCHSAPPRLNERGFRFLAAGYRLDGVASSGTVPLAIWNTVDIERRHSIDLTKGFPSRVELISAGSVGDSNIVYFAEWRALSQSIGGDRRLLDRSGRFEDLYVSIPLPGAFAVTAGQFRGLAQVDVSQRLSLSEPLAFSAGLAGRRSLSSRLTGLRAFSPSGRQPAARVEYRRTMNTPGDGWFAGATLPLTGELTIPFTDAASFELEGRPKGVFLEVYRRSGLTSFGGHSFLGDSDRRSITGVVTRDINDRVLLFGALGRFSVAGADDTRFSVGGEFTATQHLVGGLRVDHRTNLNRDPAVLLYGNVHVPFGPAAFRQAFRVQLEQRIESSNHITAVAFSHVF